MATRSTERPASPRTRPPATNGHPGPPEPSGATTTSAGPHLDPALAEELGAGGWDTSWALAPSLHTPPREPGARQATWTLERMIEGPARDALVMSEEPRALDLACGEGWLAQRLLEWGARAVIGLEARSQHRRRAVLLRGHFAVPEAELELHAEEDSPPLDERGHDVVLLVGIAARVAVEDELLRRAAAACRGICAIECEGAATDAVGRAAIDAGFAWAELISPPLGAHPLYVREDRVLLIAHAHGPAGEAR